MRRSGVQIPSAPPAKLLHRLAHLALLCAVHGLRERNKVFAGGPEDLHLSATGSRFHVEDRGPPRAWHFGMDIVLIGRTGASPFQLKHEFVDMPRWRRCSATFVR